MSMIREPESRQIKATSTPDTYESFHAIIP